MISKNTFFIIWKKVFLFLFIYLFAQKLSALKVEDLKFTNYVNDFAEVLSIEQENILNKKLSEHKGKTGNEIAIVTVPDMSGDYVEHYAVKLFEQWKIGKEKEDNGLLVLASVQERKVRLEVGYGLESIVTDGFAKNIIENKISPNFKQGKYFQGLNDGIEDIVSNLESRTAPNAEKNERDLSFVDMLLNNIVFIIFFGYIFFSWLIAILARTKSWWLGGIIGGGMGALIIFIFGVALLYLEIFIFLIILGLVLDFLVSRNYKEHKSHFDFNDPPSWWAGGTWGPGSSNWTDRFDGFSGGSSGGGGWSGDW